MADTNQKVSLGSPIDAISGVIGIANGIASLFDDSPDAAEMMQMQADEERANMRLQADLNSPYRIAKEYRKAGFNPYVAMGSGSGSSGVQSGLGSVAMPDSSYNLLPSQVGLMHADTLAKLAGAYKTSKEGSVVRDVAGSQIFKNFAEGLSADALTKLNKIEADFKNTYGDKLYQGQIAKYAAEVAELYQKANLALAQGNLAEAQEVNEQLKQVINNEIAKQEDAKSKMLAIRLNTYPQEIQLELQGKREENRRTRAQANEANASAEEHRSKAGLADAQKEFQDFENGLRKDYKKDIYENYLKKLVADGELSDKDAEDARLKFERIMRMRDAVNYTEFNSSLDAALELIKEKLKIFK